MENALVCTNGKYRDDLVLQLNRYAQHPSVEGNANEGKVSATDNAPAVFVASYLTNWWILSLRFLDF